MKPIAMVLLCTALHPAIASAEADPLRITFGYEYSKGDYGQNTDTRQHYYPFSASWQQQQWQFKASSSYLRTQGPANVSSADNGVIIEEGGSTEQQTHNGFGDTTLAMRRALELGANQGIYLDINGSVRLPTASDSSGISHRDADVALWLDGYMSLGNWLPMASLGYKWMGDGRHFETDNIWLASIGAQYQFSNLCALGSLYDYQSPISSASDPLQELFSYASCPISDKWSVTGYLVNGFSDNSVDYATGIQLSWRGNLLAIH